MVGFRTKQRLFGVRGVEATAAVGLGTARYAGNEPSLPWRHAYARSIGIEACCPLRVEKGKPHSPWRIGERGLHPGGKTWRWKLCYTLCAISVLNILLCGKVAKRRQTSHAWTSGARCHAKTKGFFKVLLLDSPQYIRMRENYSQEQLQYCR